jgi:Ca2+-binding EF-hand superfamily protein/rhodanese-related sulfurtransferase
MAENLRQELVEDFDSRFRSLRGAFLKLDADRSGYIDVDELKSMCTTYNLPTEYIQDVFDSIDINDDKKIEFTEFSKRLNIKITETSSATGETKKAALAQTRKEEEEKEEVKKDTKDLEDKTDQTTVDVSSFASLLTNAAAKIGSANILSIEEAKLFLQSENILFLDVQDIGSKMSANAYNISLGTLFFKADQNGPAPDKKLCAQHPNQPILVACQAGGQAKIAAGLLCDYGYTNVKVLNGACFAMD